MIPAIRSTFAVRPLPAYASLLHLLPLYASDATRPDHRIFNIALPLEGDGRRFCGLNQKMAVIEPLTSPCLAPFRLAERNADARKNQFLIVLGLEARVKRLEEERHQEKQ